MSFILAFVIAGMILSIGYFGNYLFRKKNIPDILILIVIGIVLGPVLKIATPQILEPVSNIFASLTLIVILFEAGLNLNLHKVLKESPYAILLAFLGFVISVCLVTVTTYFLGFSLLESVLLGTIVGGTSSSVVIPLISRCKNVNYKTKTILMLESVFTDVLVIVFAMTVLQIMRSGHTDVNFIGNRILSEFSIGAVLGFLVGIVWLKFLNAFKTEVYNDVLTLGIVACLYSLVESIGGNGGIFSICFGLTLGNGKSISKMLKMKKTIQTSRMMRRFMNEISFFMKTFFFVYLGLLVSFNNPSQFMIGVLISSVLLFGRFLCAEIISVRNTILRQDKRIVGILFPRGLSAAVFVELLKENSKVLASFFGNVITTVIITSVVLSSIGISLIEKRKNLGKA